MKKYLSTTMLVVVYIIGSSFSSLKEGDLSKEDRKYINDYLKQSQKELFSRIKNLSDDQWTFKANETSWSPAEICEHIFKTEGNLVSRADAMDTTTFKQTAVRSVCQGESRFHHQFSSKQGAKIQCSGTHSTRGPIRKSQSIYVNLQEEA